MEYVNIILFAIIACGTPGPNNTMIMTSGLNFGIRRSLPHFFGIILGFPLMVIAVGLGLAGVFEQYPTLHVILKIVGAAYLTFLAWKIASAPVTETRQTKGKPLTFLQGAAFQWVNPKAWTLAIGATATYTIIGASYISQVLTISVFFLLFGGPCALAWLSFGASLKKFLKNAFYVRVFNISMAALLMLSLLPVFRDLYQQFVA